MEFLLYLLLGAAAGVLAGLFGVGGGLVIVPVLVWVFAGVGIDGAVGMHLAIGTSLATIVFTSIASVRAHHRRGAVLWPAFARLAPGIVVGAWFGAAIAGALPSAALRQVFGIFELTVAAQMALDLRPAPHRSLPGPFGMAMAGAVIGTVSAIVGIGGGTLTVPFLAWCNVAMKRAVATSAAAGLPIALAGATGFLVAGWGEPALPAGSSGYLYWPALAGVVAASMWVAPFGARLAHSLPGPLLKRIFAGFLALLGAAMLSG